MIKIAITGNIGTGKTAISQILKSMGFKVFEADKEVKNLMKNKALINDLKKEFQSKVPGLIKQNKIDTMKLGDFIFSNFKELKKLEDIIHPKIWTRKGKFFKENVKEKVVFLDIPLVFEKNLQESFDYIIYTSVSLKIQKERVLKRKEMNLTKFNQIIKKQNKLKQSQLKVISLYLNTNQSLDKLALKIKKFLESTLNLEIKANETEKRNERTNVR